MTSDILSNQVKETVSIVLELLLEEHAGQTTASFPTTRKMLPFASKFIFYIPFDVYSDNDYKLKDLNLRI